MFWEETREANGASCDNPNQKYWNAERQQIPSSVGVLPKADFQGDSSFPCGRLLLFRRWPDPQSCRFLVSDEMSQAHAKVVQMVLPKKAVNGR